MIGQKLGPSEITAKLGGGDTAQFDDLELLCSPSLFSDDFESGLTTHWCATVP